MKTCKELTQDTVDLVGGDPAGPKWEEAREHLAVCGPCMEYVRQMGLTVEVLKALPGGDGAQTRAKLLALYTQWVASRG